MNGFIQHQAFLFSDFYLYHDTHKRSILKLLPLESEVFSRYWSLVLISGNIWKKKKYVIKSCFPSVVLRSRLVFCKRAFVRLSRNWDVFPRWPLGVFHNLPLQEWFCEDKPWGKLQLDPWKGWPLGYCNSICNSDLKLPQPWLDRQTAHFWGGKKENQSMERMRRDCGLRLMRRRLINVNKNGGKIIWFGPFSFKKQVLLWFMSCG